MQRMMNQIPEQIKIAADITSAGTFGLWLAGILPTVVAMLGGLWALIQIIDFFAQGKHKKWFKWKRR